MTAAKRDNLLKQRVEIPKKFTQGDWTVRVYPDGYIFFGPSGFAAFYLGKSAERIEKSILDGPPYLDGWAACVVLDIHVGSRRNCGAPRNRHRAARW